MDEELAAPAGPATSSPANSSREDANACCADVSVLWIRLEAGAKESSVLALTNRGGEASVALELDVCSILLGCGQPDGATGHKLCGTSQLC